MHKKLFVFFKKEDCKSIIFAPNPIVESPLRNQTDVEFFTREGALQFILDRPISHSAVESNTCIAD